MPAPLSVHDAIDLAWDAQDLPEEEQTVDAVASVGTALEELCRELDEKKPLEKDGAKLLWWSVAEQASLRDYQTSISKLSLSSLTVLFNKFLSQLKTAPEGVGGAAATEAVAAAPSSSEDSDGIPD